LDKDENDVFTSCIELQTDQRKCIKTDDKDLKSHRLYMADTMVLVKSEV